MMSLNNSLKSSIFLTSGECILCLSWNMATFEVQRLWTYMFFQMNVINQSSIFGLCLLYYLFRFTAVKPMFLLLVVLLKMKWMKLVGKNKYQNGVFYDHVSQQSCQLQLLKNKLIWIVHPNQKLWVFMTDHSLSPGPIKQRWVWLL